MNQIEQPEKEPSDSQIKRAGLVMVTEVYSRVSGYFRPVNQWNKGKREEFSERKFSNGNKINEKYN
jgi:hypothetical protein